MFDFEGEGCTVRVRRHNHIRQFYGKNDNQQIRGKPIHGASLDIVRSQVLVLSVGTMIGTLGAAIHVHIVETSANLVLLFNLPEIEHLSRISID